MSAGPMQSHVDRVLIGRGEIERRLDELSAAIAADAASDAAAADRPTPEITLVPILTGSIIFVADLIRRLPVLMQVHLISVSSYPGTVTTSRPAAINDALTRLPDDLTGRHVLVIDDILDSGQTLGLVRETLAGRGADAVRTCVLLRKDRPEARACEVDYVGFDIPDEFVVGYGLDFDDYYRNLPDVVTLRREVVEAGGPAAWPAAGEAG